jgi:hypothetical protein
LNRFILNIILLFLANVSLAQKLYNHKLDENKWSDIKEGVRYENEKKGGSSDWTFEDKKQYKKWQKSKGLKSGKGSGGGSGNGEGGGDNGSGFNEYRKPIVQDRSSSDWNFNPPNLKGLSWIGWLIMGVLIIGVVYLIVMFVINSNSGKKKVTPIDYVEDEIPPSEIPLTELQRLLKEALDNKDFRAAVRIYYLFILKDLSARQWIEWQREKTNMHYLYEMQKQSVYTDFSQTVNYFEIVWYGKRDINQNQFNMIQPSFTNLLNKLGVE